MRRHHSSFRLGVMLVVGLVAALVAGSLGEWVYAPTIGWCFSAALYSAWVWIAVGRLSPASTKSHASREEPTRGVADVLVTILSVASLFAVAFVLVHASNSRGVTQVLLACLALGSVALSWFLLHTLYMLRYARLYYLHDGGIDFNQKDDPQYTDFAYLSFTLGMTYQVSDTNIGSHRVRVTVLQHCLLSFLFGSVILATTINLVAGLS